jgi:RNA polymerase sigma-70 factor (ECF subfamily)
VTDQNRLFEAFLAGNDAAFAELYRDLNPRLSAYCHKLSSNNADDIMQELWERVIAMRAPALRKKKLEVINPSAFLFRMLKNLAIDEFRRGKNEISLETHSSDETHGSYGTYVQEASDIEAVILEALEKLSTDDREVLLLNIYSGYSFGEIAEIVGASTDAIWQRASRARVKLRKIVTEDAKQMGISLPTINGSVKIETKV